MRITLILTLCFSLPSLVASAPGAVSVVPWHNGAQSALCFGFDDGAGTEADTIMTNRGMHCYFSINSQWPAISSNWALWNAMVQHGHEVSTHSANHFDLCNYYSSGTPQANYADYVANVRTGVTDIEAHIPGYKVLTDLNPSSAGNRDQRRILDSLGVISTDQSAGPCSDGCVRGYEGFTYTEAMHPNIEDPNPFFGINRDGCDYRDLANMQGIITSNAINKGAMTNIFWHGVTADFRGLMDWLKVKQDSGYVWVGLYRNIIKYMKERIGSTVQTISSTNTEIILSLTDTLPDAIYDFPLTLEVEVPASWSGMLVYVSQSGSAQDTASPFQRTGFWFVRCHAVPGNGDITLSTETSHSAPSVLCSADDGISVSASPNPFNPAVMIAVSMDPAGVYAHTPMQLKICTVNGRCVSDLTSSIVNGRVPWDASGQPSGIYIVKTVIGNRIVTHRISLIK